MNVMPQCSKCPGAYCSKTAFEELDKKLLPAFCPMKTSKESLTRTIKKYKMEGTKRIYIPATITEKQAYEEVRGIQMAVRPRIKEIIEFGRLTKTKRMGLAFCAGMKDEAARIVKILENSGFEIASVLCKCGGVDKTNLEVSQEYKIGDPSNFEAGCNPILQAQLLNESGTNFNIIVGLCLGHDMLFTLNSKAPVTTLIVKDRLLGHNPLAAIYTIDSYYRSLK